MCGGVKSLRCRSRISARLRRKSSRVAQLAATMRRLLSTVIIGTRLRSKTPENCRACPQVASTACVADLRLP